METEKNLTMERKKKIFKKRCETGVAILYN